MNNEMFMIELDNAFNRAKKTLIKKGQVYSGEEDRLEQFHRAGTAQGISPHSALMGMAMKHITRLSDMCKHPNEIKIEQWNETIGDARNYMLLLEALVRDCKERSLDNK